MEAEVKVVDGGLATEIERTGFSIHVRTTTENTVMMCIVALLSSLKG